MPLWNSTHPTRPRTFELKTETPNDFVAQHPVFRIEEMEEAYERMGRNPSGVRATLAYHVNRKRLWVIRRGVYGHRTFVDPWLVASKLTPDAVISHQGALSLHGLTGMGHDVWFMTKHRTSTTRHNEMNYWPLRVARLDDEPGIEAVERSGFPVKLTSLERTFVDCLARFECGPSPQALLELFIENAHRLDARELVLLGVQPRSPVLASRLGFFLSCAQTKLGPREVELLDHHRLKAPDYFLRSARTKRDELLARWNLIISPGLGRFWRGPLA